MVKLETFSSNVVLVLNEILNNQKICKYLYYANSNPLSQPDIADTKTLMFKQLFPFPFNPNVTNEEGIQIRVYYPKGKFDTYELITNAYLCFDIIIPNALYLVKDENGQSKVRPYEIMKQLINHFSKKSISTLGIIHFKEFYHLNVNDKFDCLRVTAETTNIGGQ